MQLLPNICEWSPAPYLIFSDNIWGNFIYYSHLFPAISGLLIAIFVYWHNPRGKANISLLALSIIFACWCLIDLVLWATDRPDLIMFFWSILIFFDFFIYVSAFYFIYSFVTNQWPKWWHDAIFFVLFLPLALFAHTPLNLTAFDYTNCWREALEGPLWQYYVYNIELLIAIGIVCYSIYWFRSSALAINKRELLFATIGIILMLMSFSFGNITGSIETDWELGQYGLFGMPAFVAFLTYLIVRFKTFNAKLIATEALIVGLGVLVLSLMFVRKLENVLAIAFATFILTTILGVLLIRSVRNEIAQREKNEELAKKLAKANQRLRELDKMKSEFVSIASHQLRSPLTSIRGYASMVLDGSFGKVPQKAADAIQRIADSSATMASSVEDYLNVSRIEAGNMKYELVDFNLKEEASRVVDDKRREAMQKGLLLTFKSSVMNHGIVNADLGKTRQILHNLINNALKYTPKGSIEVAVVDDQVSKKLHVHVTDTGIGLSPMDIEGLFGKFERAKGAAGVNATGTGLGLYIARKMANDMQGDITVTSPGPGHGSTFTLTLPLQM